jgi:Fe-S oxidoreductase
MKTVEAIKQIDSCNECGLCLNTCQTYEVTQNEAFSPIGRLQTAKSIFQGNEVSSEAVDGIYSCLKCARCHVECPQGIDIVGIVRKAQANLVRRGIGPLERPNRIIEGIQKLGNSVNGDPAKRWDWLPEEFPKRESDTLLYLGCTACFLAPQAAASSYLLLKELGVDFMMLKDEGCCGDYLHSIGRIDLAREKFQENADKFKRLGIKKIITVCAGCYRHL